MRAAQAISCLLFVLGTSVWGQNTVDEEVHEAVALEQKGQVQQALVILQPLVVLRQLSAVEAGRVWTALGYGYQEEGDLAKAGKAYQQALRVLKEGPSNKTDCATALDNLADWYRTTGDQRAAIRMEKIALRLHQEDQDHAGAAWTLIHLANIELARKDKAAAQDYLDAAEKETLLTPKIDDRYLASLYSTKGWLAELEGNTLTAIFDYNQSLSFQPCQTCMLAGWDYVLLGKAYSSDGQLTAALENMRRGLAILGDTIGQHSSAYLAAEIAYAEALDSSGEHAESVKLKNAAKIEQSSFRDAQSESGPVTFLVGH